MHYDPVPVEEHGFLSTRTIITVCVLLVLGGLAWPTLTGGKASVVLARATGMFRSAEDEGALVSVRDTARTVATRSRLRGIKAELRLWTAKNGLPASTQLVEAVGRGTATDGWGRLIRFAAPMKSANGWLRSVGPDGKVSEDDIFEPISYDELTRDGIGGIGSSD